MANQRAWWTLVISQEPNGPHDRTIELSDTDREHIAALIADDYTEGEIVADPPGDHVLIWESAGTDEPGDQTADSVHRVEPESTSAYYSLGPAFAAPSDDGERWGLELIQMRNGDETTATPLGRHPDEQTAKEYAQYWERCGQTPDENGSGPTVCDRCGDHSDSEPGLPCGRLVGPPGHDDDHADAQPCTGTYQRARGAGDELP